MKYPVRLFLGNEEVEFSTPPEILFNYSETELTNPTIVKNSYSKTVTIEGTPQNNKIFGHIYDMQRLQGYNGSINGVGFNPLVKTDFTLYYNGSIYESGYFKLDEVRRNNNNIEYDITLYGGLGDFFYNLTYREDGNPMELSDLTYNCEKEGENFGFTINKETVYSAWTNVPHEYRWDTINFAPCYNGIPGNFSADRALINNSGVTEYQSTTVGGTYRNYSMGILGEELTEWETFDLRSYLQRPIVRVKEVLGACFDPDNNGGYTVNLDQDFFYNNNPYYWKAWMTLPLLPELDVPATVQTPLTITSITKEDTYLYDIYNGLGTVSNVRFNMNVVFTPGGTYTGTTAYLDRKYRADGGVTLQDRFAKQFDSETYILVQMLGYNSSGQIAVTSDMYYLTGSAPSGFRFNATADFAKGRFSMYEPETTVNNIRILKGKFTKKNGQFVFTDYAGNTQNITFSFPSDAEVSDIKLKIVAQTRDYTKRTWTGGEQTRTLDPSAKLWSKETTTSNTWQDVDTVRNLNSVWGSFSYSPMGATGITTSFEGFYSNRVYTKKDLMTLGVTPSDFLLSYAKIFGLYFIKNVESKTIDILTRHNFYKRNEVVNINDLVDKGSDIKIIPNSPQYQYYDFALDQVESEAAKSYKNTYGNQYGTASVNTGYQYEKQHKSLLDGNIFKAGINVLEKDKYYLKPVWGQTYYNGPVYVCNHFSWWYPIAGGTDEDRRDTKPITGETINPDGLVYYDMFAKPQFHTEANKASDGSMVLLFEDLVYDTRNKGYHLTDDTQEMFTMNDGQPCWIMTRGEYDRTGKKVALSIDYIPSFSRDTYNDYNYIQYSFDLGSPLTTYVPEKYVSDWQSIYSKGWKSYISDLYDVNTRVLNCRCLLRERPNPDWLRRFYWFDNSYWRLNNIKDWNISSFGTTEMEFIKVQDIANYDNVKFSTDPIVEWHLDQYSIGREGGTISGYIYVSDGSIVTAADTFMVKYSDGTVEYLEPPQNYMSPVEAYGAIQIPVTLTIPANPSSLTRTITFSVEPNTYLTTYVEAEITQEENPVDYSKEYFTIKATTDGNLHTSPKNNITGTSSYKYKKNNEGWINGNSFTVIPVNTGDKVSLSVAESVAGKSWNCLNVVGSATTCQYEFEGNILSLCYGDDFLSIDPYGEEAKKISFDKTFSGLTGLTIVDNLVLPIMDLVSGLTNSRYAYSRMFSNCTNLTSAAFLLPAITAKTSCYSSMFDSCTSLVNAPTIEATVSENNCFTSMFKGCTSLVNAPAIKLTSLAQGACAYMFQNCTALENVPDLVATGASYSACDSMFYNCSSLQFAPALPATVLSGGCYQNMFYNCTALEEAPNLPATTLPSSVYDSMFRNCTSLVVAPAISATSLGSDCCRRMFQGCVELVTGPILLSQNLTTRCYYDMFRECQKLSSLTCVATNPNSDYTKNWLEGASQSGTFTKKAGVTWERSTSGIPNGWTVVEIP